MTDPKKVEDTKKPAAPTDQAKKDEGTVKAAAESTTSKPAEPVKDAPKSETKPADGGANIQTKHENIKSDQDFTKDDVGDDHGDPETLTDDDLKATIGDVAFASDTNHAEDEVTKREKAHADALLNGDTPTAASTGGKDDTEAQRNSQDPIVPVKGSLAASKPSIDRLKDLVYKYPKDARDGTVVFGYGGVSITIGDLRAVVAVL